MLVGFVGSPISGKTTTAALLFASLKENGQVTEFVPEQARYVIARRRYSADLNNLPESPLTDRDQAEILYRQEEMERVFDYASPRSIVIADCAAFLTLLYVHSLENQGKLLPLAAKSASRFDLLFRCRPVQPGIEVDPNRVHNFEQSQEIDAKIDGLLVLLGVPPTKIVELGGPSQVRASQAHYQVLERFICRRS